MFLNEIKPPLSEAVELAHYGIPGMKWGRRKKQERSTADEYDDMVDLERQERHERNKKIIAGSALAAVGVVATVAVLHKTGAIKINPEIIAKAKEAASKVSDSSAKERVRGVQGLANAGQAAKGARDAYKNSNFAKKTFTPRDPSENLIPGWPKGGFKSESKNPFTEGDAFGPYSKRNKERDAANDMFDAMFTRGAHKVHTMDDDIWDIPMLEITSGRRK